MKKNLLKVMSLVLALMLVFSTTAFAAYTVDELSGANLPVKIKDGIEKDPATGVNIVEGVNAYLIGSSSSNASKYDAATDTYKGVSFAEYSNLLTFRQSDGLQYELGNKYVVSFDISLSASPAKDTNIKFMRYNGTAGTGRADGITSAFVIPAGAAANVYRHVEFVYDLTNATARDTGLNDFGMWVTSGGIAEGTVDIANFRIEKYVENSPETNLLTTPYGQTNPLTEYTVTCNEDWENLIGWKDSDGLSMTGGKKYKFTADIELSAALENGKVVKITRATAGWSNRSNTYGATYTIPAGSSGVCKVEIILDFTDITDITNGGTYNGLLLVTNQNLAQDVKVSNCKLVIADEYAVYHTIGEDILVDAPVTVNHTKYTGDSMPASVTCANAAGNDGGLNAFAWEYSDTFKLIQGKTYRISFDWSVPSTTDTETKTISWCLSDATTSDYAIWTGRGDYICNNNLIAYVTPDTLSGTITKDFVYNPAEINKGIVLWRGGTSSAAAEYTISNVKIVPVLQEIDVQTDGDEIVVIQNEETANAFNDLIILAEYEGDVLKTFDFTTPATIAEKNEEGTIALRAKLSGVGESSTVKMFRWRDFSSLDPVSAPVDVK